MRVCQIFTGTLTIDDIHKKSGFILAFLALTKRLSKACGTSDNFLTDATYKDTVILVCGLLLFIKILEIKLGKAKAEQFLHMYRFIPSYLSSRFLEYLFAFCRLEHRCALIYTLHPCLALTLTLTPTLTYFKSDFNPTPTLP